MDIIQGLIASGNAGRSGWRILNNKGTFGIVNNRTSNVSYSILNNGVIGTGADFVNTYVASSSSPTITATPSATTTGTTGDYTYQVFTYTTETAGAGTGQSLYTITVPTGGVVCDVLVVGGGGGGGSGHGGGGGAGQLVLIKDAALNGTYTIRVGSGGIYSISQERGGARPPTKGKNSTFGTITAEGGGASTNISADMNGGSGAGGDGYTTDGGTGGFGVKDNNTDTFSSGTVYSRGNNGASNTGFTGGGGGGAGVAGNVNVGGDGLSGITEINFDFLQNFGSSVGQYISGENKTYFAGGGGGGAAANNSISKGGGGIGGAGNGGPGGSGLASTGSGGGGGSGGGNDGGNGGSGIVIIRYLTPTTSSSVNLIQSSNINVITNYVGGVSSSSTGGGSSQWTTISGPEIYYNDGNVGIGTLDPVAPLHIYNNTTTATLPTEIVVAGTTSATISGTTDRYISFPYSGSATTKDYTFTTTEVLNVDVLVVGGGGAGGNLGGGGGGGDVLYQTNISLPIGTYNISVGAGGANNPSYRGRGNNGNNSSISGTGITTITAAGGGGGGGYDQAPLTAPLIGTSSGGGGGAATRDATVNTGASSTYSGAGGNGNTTLITPAGGGGGSVGAGGVATIKSKAGNGGIGNDISITGVSQQYGGGGGGTNWAGEFNYTAPDIGGGTGVYGGGNGRYTINGSLVEGTSGTPNTGGGGGGGHDTTGRAGGSGIVIIRYRRQTQLTVSNARLLLDATTTGTASIDFRRGTGADAQNDFRIINDTNSSLKLQCENTTQSFSDATANIAWFSSNETIIHKNTTMNGRVGIGGTTYHATRSLDVVGDANVFGVMSAGSLSVTGNATITNSSSSNVSLTIQNGFVSLPNEIVVAGTTSAIISGTTDRYISFPYSGSATTKDYTFTTTENLICDILVVGGGGAGGRSGGGGGTVLYTQNVYSPVGSYTVKVGNGGISLKTGGVGNTQGANGNDSDILFGATTIFKAKGGGFGAANGSPGSITGGTGGSGGGSESSGSVSVVSSANIISTNTSSSSFTTTTSAPNGTTIRGNVGGLGAIKLPGYYYYVGGGGGGAGGVGGAGNTTNNTSGAGGIGVNIDITGANIMYGSGGSGGVYNDFNQGNVPATPGDVTDGGGTGAYATSTQSIYGTIPTAGRGGGGGGWSVNALTNEQIYPRDGGSGIIIIRYRKLTTGSTAIELTAPSSSVSITEPIAKGIKQYPETPSTTVNSWTDNGFTVTTKTSDAVLGATPDIFQLFNNVTTSPEPYHSTQLYNASSPFNYTGSTSFKGANGIVLYIDLGRSITPRSMRMAPRDNAPYPTFNFLTAAPGVFKIYASNDSASWTSTTHASWTEIHSQTTSLTFNYNQFTSFGNFSSITTPYRYFAMVVYNLTGNYSYLTFSEWDIFGTYDMTPVVINSDYKYLSFTHSGGTETQTSYTVNFPESTLCDILVVGGGGGGGNDRGGGGGGGGVIYSQNITLNGAYTINVGKEGVGTTSGTGGGTGTRGTNGSNSSISGSNITTITAIGGGGGGACASGVIRDGLSGGSGGGGSQFNGAGSGGTGTSGQGRNGGIGFESGAGGGGGGAVNVGNDANSTNAGNGGLGLSNTITNSAVIYGSGGGGGGTSPLSYGGSIKLPGTGGSSGAGNGGGVNANGVNATIFGCGGGGGGVANGSVTTGGNGFAGIVIIRYKSTKSGNQTYKVGNFNGEFKVISSVSNTDTDYIKITTAGAITNPTGTASWNTGSDRRIKENIERASYDKCFENINRLELNRFNYISGFNTVNRDRTQLGFIAQEVQDIFPKSISSQEYYSNTLNIPDLLSIDVSQINYSLYGAVKKLIEINNEKDVRLKTLGNRLKTLKTFLNIADVTDVTDVSTSNITVDVTVPSTSNVEVIEVLDVTDVSTSNITVDATVPSTSNVEVLDVLDVTNVSNVTNVTDVTDVTDVTNVTNVTNVTDVSTSNITV